jgi:hypothetical protein
MSIEIRYEAMSPETGVQRTKGAMPPGMGGPHPGMAPPAPVTGSFAKRPDTLQNKTVYLVDTGFGGSYNFMLQLQKWFKENMPSVKTVRRRKPGIAFMDDSNELWEEIKEKGDGAVLGVAG